jgi:cell division protein FtsQ
MRRGVPIVLGAVVATALVVAVGLLWVRGLGAWQPHWEAPWPVIRTVHLVGVSRLSPEEVRTVLPLHEGERVSTGRLRAAAHRLSAHPWIAAATLSWVMPDTLVVTVQERQPAAIVRDGGVPWYVDREGVLLGPAGAKPGPIGVELNGVSVSRLRAGSSEEQRRVRDGVALLELMRGDGVQTAQVTVGSDGAAEASFNGWRLRFRSGRIEEQWRRFWQVAARIPADARHPKEVDLRFANSVVVRS